MASRHVLYIQHANPGAYPPIQHSAVLLADAGWSVELIGVTQPWVAALDFPERPNISLRLTPPSGKGWRLKLHYLRFCMSSLWRAFSTRPTWLYVSDTLATPVALLASFFRRSRVLYHEHDLPDVSAPSRFLRFPLLMRRHLLRRADLVVVPNRARGDALNELAGTALPIHCVWNCPDRSEVAAKRRPRQRAEFWVVYQGSIVPARLPATVVRALCLLPSVHLRVIGYGTSGHPGYVDELASLAEALGVRSRLDIMGCIPRRELIDAVRGCDLGLSLMPLRPADPNERHMTGASSKAFEYLAQGVPLLVADLPDWREMFVQRGVARTCRPDDPNDMASAITWFVEHQAEALAMGERGRQLVLSEWNYERQFGPVLQRLNGSG